MCLCCVIIKIKKKIIKQKQNTKRFNAPVCPQNAINSPFVLFLSHSPDAGES